VLLEALDAKDLGADRLFPLQRSVLPSASDRSTGFPEHHSALVRERKPDLAVVLSLPALWLDYRGFRDRQRAG
jgi:hypothetical protein